MLSKKNKIQFAVCIKNDDYEASLELRKIYRLIPDAKAVKFGQLRVVDESGEDYLYPSDFFILIDLPQTIERAISSSL